nr:uncharacterized protein LOC129414781 [Misgurnus anguillicaudatus]
MAGRPFDFSSEDDLYSLCDDTDCTYCRISIPMTRPHLSQRHLKYAVFYKKANSVQFTIPCYCTDGVHGRSHWHCSTCVRTIQRCGDFKKHLQNHGYEVAEKCSGVQQKDFVGKKRSYSEDQLSSKVQAQIANTCQIPVKTDLPPQKDNLKCHKCNMDFSTVINLRRHEKGQHGMEDPMLCLDPKNGSSVTPKKQYKTDLPPQNVKLKCRGCKIEFSTVSNLRRHEKQQHGMEDPMFCVDPINGIYVTPKEKHGQRLPLHIIKHILLRRISCELERCKDMSRIATQNGHPGWECEHLIRTKSAQGYIPPPRLNDVSLDKMLDNGLISISGLQECKYIHLKAREEGVDCVFPVFWGEYGLSQRYIYFSVFTNLKDNWCKVGRTIVTFNTVSAKWHCQCKATKDQSCVHIYLSMWWTFQERPELLQMEVEVTLEETKDVKEQGREMDDNPQPSIETASGLVPEIE